MVASDNEIYQQASTLFHRGDWSGARKLMLYLYEKSSDPAARLQAILALVTPINHKNISEAITYCDEGLLLAKSLNLVGETAYLKSVKAYSLTIKASPMIHQMGLLNLPPGWFEFSLEVEQKEYTSLKTQADGLLKGMRRLIDEAELTGRSLPNKSTLAHVLMFKGQALSQEFLLLQLLWLKDLRFKKLLRFLKLNPMFFQPKEVQEKIRQSLVITKSTFLESAKLFQESSDYSNAGYSLYNLANRLRGFRAAKFLKQALKLAQEANDAVLTSQCERLAKEIPGYALFKFVL